MACGGVALGRRGFGEVLTCGEGVAFGGRGLCGKAWLSGPESPGTNPGSCFTFLIWTDVLLNCVLL